MEEEPCPKLMRVLIDMVNAVGVEGACPADKSVDLVAFAQQ